MYGVPADVPVDSELRLGEDDNDAKKLHDPYVHSAYLPSVHGRIGLWRCLGQGGRLLLVQMAQEEGRHDSDGRAARRAHPLGEPRRVALTSCVSSVAKKERNFSPPQADFVVVGVGSDQELMEARLGLRQKGPICKRVEASAGTPFVGRCA